MTRGHIKNRRRGTCSQVRFLNDIYIDFEGKNAVTQPPRDLCTKSMHVGFSRQQNDQHPRMCTNSLLKISVNIVVEPHLTTFSPSFNTSPIILLSRTLCDIYHI